MNTQHLDGPRPWADHRVDRRRGPSLALFLGLIGAGTASVSIFVADLVLSWLLPVSPLAAVTLGHAVLMGLVAAAVGGIVGAGVGYRQQRRLLRLSALADAWLRGNLALRTGETAGDELGMLAERLDLLVEHLQEDEEDLVRLRESNVRLTDQVRALAVVEERNRLARELHDSVKQHLFSLTMTASAVRTHLDMVSHGGQALAPDLQEMVQEMETAAQTAQRETTRLIEDLRPAPLQERGLPAALNDYTLLFGAQEHLLVYLDVDCGNVALPPRVAEALYRVAQEALHNVARHAQATRVDVQLQCRGSRVALTVEDNGKGFDPSRTRKGLGISSMHDRLLSIGGRLQVESAPGAGTTVTAEVDISRQDASEEQPQDEGGVRSRTDAWAWLGQRLVIPVGQTWPWLPADQARHLRGPSVGPGTLILKRERRFLGLVRSYTVSSEKQRQPLVRLRPDRGGISWEMGHGSWTLRRVRGLKGRAVVERNEQPLAAMQVQSEDPETVIEIIYDNHFYALSYPTGSSVSFTLASEDGAPVLAASEDVVKCHQAMPLPLLATVLARVIDDASARRIVLKADTSAADKHRQRLRNQLEQELRALVRDADRDLPEPARTKLHALERMVLTVLPEIEDPGSGNHDAYVVRQTIRDYLPTTLADYRALPAAFAEGEPIQEGKTAQEHLLRQLSLLEKAIGEIATRLPRERAQDLLSHGRFLAGKFGQREAQSGEESHQRGHK
ncbi:MAG: sensor histidine kinase [Anaerolineae bacterium]